jgi:hypothetical protein
MTCMHDEGAEDPRVAPLISGVNKNMFVFLFQVAIERRGGGYGVRLQRSLGVGCCIDGILFLVSARSLYCNCLACSRILRWIQTVDEGLRMVVSVCSKGLAQDRRAHL